MTVKTEPSLTTESTCTVPSWLSTSCRTMANPSPVPFSLVVKNGSKMLSRIVSPRRLG